VSTTTGQVAVVDERTKKYLTLLELSRAIATQRELPKLFYELASRLRTLFDFSDLGIFLHDDSRDIMRLHLVGNCDRTKGQTAAEIPLEGSIAGWVWQHQELAVVRNLDLETRFTIARAGLNQSVKSVCSLPLTTTRRLGVVSFWSEKEGAYDQLDLEFAKLVVAQIAVAIEAHGNQQKLMRERDRSQFLLDMTNTMVSNLELRDLLRAVSASIRQIMHCDAVGVWVPNEKQSEFRHLAMDFPESKGFAREDLSYPIDTSPLGDAFKTGKPVVGSIADVVSEEVSLVAREEGLESVCALPLISRNRTLGVMALGCRPGNSFSPDDVDFLEQAAGQVAIAVENAMAFSEIEALKNQLHEEKLYLEEEIRSEYNFEEIIGSSPALKRALQDVATVATTDSTVLIYGETGTGKELIAHAIHNLSERRERTLVKVNCAAIPTGLLESELFGHEKGAFTGAIDRRIGRFELANQGTIFLDEVEDIPLELQSKLLRVLQEQEFERLGSSRTLRVSVRVVAATNSDLAELVAEKKFRSDLYYRLNVFPINVPPLRERPEDIPLLVNFFAHKFAQQMKRPIESVPKETMAALTSYHWPGNIRELQNLVERGVILSRGSSLEIPLAELKHSNKVSNHANGSTTLENVERDHILRVLGESNWVIGGPAGAAERLGMNRTTLNHRMRKLGIVRPQPQQS
jgi:formate hydrogenlyase transcriptional activator